MLVASELTHFFCARFSENVMNKPGFVDIYPASRIPRNMQRHFKSIHRIKPWGDEEQRNQMDTTKQKGLRIVTDSGTLSTALRWVSDEEVCSLYSTHQPLIINVLYVINLTFPNFPKIRKQVYLVGNSEPRENITVLGKLINARDELAKVIFFMLL